jgi:hypothetical protein
MDIDLEQEFQLLMRTVIKQIGEKVERGELTDHEAADLLRMVEDRMQFQKESVAWNTSGCNFPAPPQDYRDEDWPPNVDPETGWDHSRCW